MTVRPQLAAAMGEARRRGLISAVEIVPSPYCTADAIPLLRARLDEIQLPYAFHFIDSSVLSADFPSPGLLESRVAMLEPFEPLLVSEHFTAHRLGDLDFAGNLPPIATPALREVYAENLATWCAAWGLPPQRLCFENVPTLYRHEQSTEDPVAFFFSLAHELSLGILLDLHNLYVDERAGVCDVEQVLDALDPTLVREIHLAGGKVLAGGSYVDGHCSGVPPRVFELLESILRRCAPDLVILEREHDFADQTSLLVDLERINALVRAAGLERPE